MQSARTSGMKLAVVGPTFFSYTQGIVAEFERRGVETLTFDEKHSNRIIDKIMYRLGLAHHPLSPLPRHLRALTDRIIAAGCTDVLLVGVEVIDRGVVKRLRDHGVAVHFYTWDAAANKPRFLSYLDYLTSASTFDPDDSRMRGLAYIPLFGEAMFETEREATGGEDRYDIVFCGTVHSSRSRTIATLLDADWANRLRVKTMLYYHSRRLFMIKGLLSRSARRILPLVSEKSFSKTDIAQSFATSRFVLDTPHPGQSGMTARTFEALLSGARLLTSNRNTAALLPASFADRVIVISDISDAAAINFAGHPRPGPLSSEQRYFLSLERFVDQLLDLMRPRG